jgi:D-alanyl-lipoteichoic acid acyltransferase DltB (MBOAT superfamily)
MLFNSLTFPIFLILVLAVYWSLNQQRPRNYLLLVASMIFYGWWDYRFLFLLFFSSGLDYWCAIKMTDRPAHRRLFLGISLVCNLGILAAFKYFNFFSENLRQTLALLGIQADWPTLNVVLPVGISFYTFQALSYTIDVYRGKETACRDPLTYFLYITFFPQLVAGPIERSSAMLPQFRTHKTFDPDLATLGLRYMLWGFILKCVVADNLSPIVNCVYTASEHASAFELLFGTWCFAFQIYGDFAGYSYIAIGSAALLGIRLRQNFNLPYLAGSVREFWTRWHMSLTSWFRDYVYIGLLNGSRVGPIRYVCNILLTFGLSGLWHGANWTFIIWGLLNGVFYFVHLAEEKTSRWAAILRRIVTFHLVCLGWVFFRSANVRQALDVLTGIVQPATRAGWNTLRPMDCMLPMLVIGLVVIAEVIQRHQPDIVWIDRIPRPLRLSLYYSLTVAFLFLGTFQRTPFIYFQF